MFVSTAESETGRSSPEQDYFMKTKKMLVLTLAGVTLSGCVSAKRPVAVMATPEYAAKEPIATSLFPSDQAVLGDEAVARILSSKLELPAKA